jgi:threonine aldolase
MLGGTAVTQVRVDLYSDTITKPTPAMRQFMCQADVGNEQEREDPTVNRLVEMVCELLGKEDAIYLPSGTMCNQIAFRVHCRQGDEIIMDETAHPIHSEAGGVAALSGAMIRTVRGDRGIFTGDQVEAALRDPTDNHSPRSRLVSIEQTTNLGGGAVWPLETVREVCEVAHNHSLATHMDGARLLNAVVASGVPAREYAKTLDSVWIDFSKGLGAPVGAVLAGSREFVREAWRFKHQFGGAMRQAGIIAAACVYALEHHVDRLQEDHDNARLLANGLSSIDGITVESVETNIVFFDIAGLGITAAEFCNRLLQKGVRMIPVASTRIRAVTHLDVDKDGITFAVDAAHDCVRAL